MKSSGTPAKDSTHCSGHSKAGSRTTACPSRRTSTVSVSKRNSFGRLAAWLLPVQNTLAFFVFMIVIIDTNRANGVKREIYGFAAPVSCAGLGRYPLLVRTWNFLVFSPTSFTLIMRQPRFEFGCG